MANTEKIKQLQQLLALVEQLKNLDEARRRPASARDVAALAKKTDTAFSAIESQIGTVITEIKSEESKRATDFQTRLADILQKLESAQELFADKLTVTALTREIGRLRIDLADYADKGSVSALSQEMTGIRGAMATNTTIASLRREMTQAVGEMTSFIEEVQQEVENFVLSMRRAIGDVSSQLTNTSIRNKLETLNTGEKLSIDSIDGLPELIQSLRTEIRKSNGRGSFFGGSARTVHYVDLSSQCDGSKTLFITPRHTVALALFGTQFPNIYRNTVDFTTANTLLTLNTTAQGFQAPQAGQTLIFLYVK